MRENTKQSSWAGTIPSEWKEVPLKSQFSFGKGLPITKADLIDEGLPVISYGQIHSKQCDGTCLQDSLLRYVDVEYSKSHPLSETIKGDIIIADTSEDLDGCGNAVLNDKDYPVYAGYHTIILRKNGDNNTKFFSYLFRTDAWRSQIRKQLTDVKLFSISQKTLKQVELLIPNIEEQNAIVFYLDNACSKIDEAISRHKQIIEKLEEYRKSVITQAVTKGLNPNAEMKGSNISWIMEVPKSWEIIRLKFLCKEHLKYGANESGCEYNPNLCRYIRITDIDENGNLKENDKKSLTEEQARGYVLDDGTVLFARSGATVGKTFLYKISQHGRAGFAGYLIAAVPNKTKMLSMWLYYFTKSSAYWNWAGQIFSQATIQNIGADKYSNLYIAIPSIKQQKEIVCYLENLCTRIDGATSRHNLSIRRLEEYRKSLIQSAVTGKIDCRKEKNED